MIFDLLFLTLLIGYSILVFRMYIAWKRVDEFVPQDANPATKISVIISVRNEEASLPALFQDLESQSYKNFEVIFIDDSSTDGTPALLQEFSKNTFPSIKILTQSEDEAGQSPKKNAIRKGIAVSEGSLIVTTDGDCRVGSNWLMSIAVYYEKHRPKMLSSPVVLSPAIRFFEKLQAVEFASLIGTGAATIFLDHAGMCNGANLAYEKTAFREVGGFAGNDRLASGDDAFVMQKISQQFPDSIAFIKSRNAIVTTSPLSDWSTFYQQRKRWAGKWHKYPSTHAKFLALAVFALYATILLTLILSVFGRFSVITFSIGVGIKLVVEFLFIHAILRFQDRGKLWPYIFPAFILYPLYALLFAVVSNFGDYQWKSRNLR